MSDAHGGIDYGSYLRLDEMLALQTPQSSPEHPDELLFIVVHQSSELWFKVLRHELDALITALEQFDTMRALLATWLMRGGRYARRITISNSAA